MSVFMIHNVRLITKNQILTDQMVLVDDGRIRHVIPVNFADPFVPADTR